MHVNFTEEHDASTSCGEEVLPGILQGAPNNPPKTDRCRAVGHKSNKVCSLLHSVGEVATRIQGGNGSFLNQSIVVMAEPVKILREGTTRTRYVWQERQRMVHPQ